MKNSRRENYPTRPTNVSDVVSNINSIKGRIAAACQRCDRSPTEIRLLPVSKTIDVNILRLAYAAGIRSLGENKVHEAQRKAIELADLDIRWVIVGHLQTNKAKYVARFAHEFQALDRLDHAEVLDRRLQREGRTLEVCIQVNSSGESSKFGLEPSEVLPFMQKLAPYTSLRVRGLMTLALLSDEVSRVRQCFSRMRALRDIIRQELPNGIECEELSMGMSGDFEVAIEEGATTVRLGQAIFGKRGIPDSYYWPTNSEG